MELLAVKWTMLNYSFKTEARLLSVQHWSCIYIHWHQTKRHQLLERRWLKPFIMFCLNNTSAAEWLWVSLPVWSVCRGSRGWFLFFCFFFFLFFFPKSVSFVSSGTWAEAVERKRDGAGGAPSVRWLMYWQLDLITLHHVLYTAGVKCVDYSPLLSIKRLQYLIQWQRSLWQL